SPEQAEQVDERDDCYFNNQDPRLDLGHRQTSRLELLHPDAPPLRASTGRSRMPPKLAGDKPTASTTAAAGRRHPMTGIFGPIAAAHLRLTGLRPDVRLQRNIP